MAWPIKKYLGLVLVALAGVGLAGILGWRWYQTQEEYFVSGTPPSELMDKIEPKHVPYDQIKPPAFLQTDALLAGSVSSTVGINFYGDYADRRSDLLSLEIQRWAAAQKGRIRLVWHFLPATSDDNDPSFEAAVFSECSHLLDARWPAHLLLLQLPQVTMRDIEVLTGQLDDKSNMLYACRQDKDIRNFVRTAVDTARGDGIDKAPFVFVVTKVFPSQTATTTAIVQSANQYLHSAP